MAIFDNHVEIWSIGEFPKGITPAMLIKNHPSVQRNPTIADVFHRTGLIEKWGRGTNRVIEMCKTAGIKPPKFEEIGCSALVTFFVNVLGSQAQLKSQLESQRGTVQVSAQVTAEVTAQVVAFCNVPRSSKEIMANLGLKHWKTFQSNYLLPLIDAKILARTIPDKPSSRLQKYRLTENGLKLLPKY